MAHNFDPKCLKNENKIKYHRPIQGLGMLLSLTRGPIKSFLATFLNFINCLKVEIEIPFAFWILIIDDDDDDITTS